jgi:DNA repair protein RadC
MSLATQTKYKLHIDDLVLDNSEKKYILKVKDLADDDKPREKLINMGPASLTSPELLAIVLTTGTKKEEVLSMASRILKDYGEKTIALQTNPKQIEKEFNIPLTKACQILACFELGRRFFKESKNGSVTLRTAKQTFEYLKNMGDLSKEHLRGIYVNSHYRVIHDEVISVGSLTANIVHPREVFRPAIEHSAAALIIAHNHPSGTVKPTISDIEITEQLIKSGKILGIELLDHVIIGKNKFFSIPANYE